MPTFAMIWLVEDGVIFIICVVLVVAILKKLIGPSFRGGLDPAQFVIVGKNLDQALKYLG